eukprot:CAMPEP_0171159814 /NCGR_PEP_ID=MMETSP0790-20130122/3233_1 /TAXON_ID=2925 /ORGANISM="Alexandrium catenella, Strain OF101" /LENGTH=158 /DNA_ID=CAMNT_0011624323 /DNA_START=121 /DNA_END=599 /DNA_ORIENTATION=-
MASRPEQGQCPAAAASQARVSDGPSRACRAHPKQDEAEAQRTEHWWRRTMYKLPVLPEARRQLEHHDERQRLLVDDAGKVPLLLLLRQAAHGGPRKVVQDRPARLLRPCPGADGHAEAHLGGALPHVALALQLDDAPAPRLLEARAALAVRRQLRVDQ